MKRKVTLTITRIRRQTATAPAHFSRGPCPVCRREVETVSAEQAAAALEVSEAALAALDAAGQVHAVETMSGQLKFCKDSLFARGQSAKA